MTTQLQLINIIIKIHMYAVSHEQLIDQSVMYTPLTVHTPQFWINTKIVQRDFNQRLSYKTSVVTYDPVTHTTGL